MQSGQCLTIGVWRGMCNASQFLNLYLGELQGNGVQSYRRVFPRAKYQSAKASASRLLWKPGVQQMLKRKLEKMKYVEKLLRSSCYSPTAPASRLERRRAPPDRNYNDPSPTVQCRTLGYGKVRTDKSGEWQAPEKTESTE